ncbi:6-phospho-3-hexuloisomerase [Litchfieldia salsa]|uniref:6-phospho-3-hexuloisomerase n=1 Tax=Litchfieldia salsa TaxID=930152 RepID=A0A1H0QC91_9BACI|nr:6-phospho-3-hexuloisomerase [Litchfieldia salsa]SDP14319.1 6-phospho-3-hexuloisomerase [Litchfieldia salsa]
MLIADNLSKIIEELTSSIGKMNSEEAEVLVNEILMSNKVFVAGAGRSGLMVKAFAMRLMHLGKEVYVVGETVTPGMGEGDLLLIVSGSGETKSLVSMAEKAISIGGKIATVTLSPDSTIGKLAATTVKLSGVRKDEGDHNQSIQPMGSLFEQTVLLFLDAVILTLMSKDELTSTEMYGKHANLE